MDRITEIAKKIANLSLLETSMKKEAMRTQSRVVYLHIRAGSLEEATAVKVVRGKAEELLPHQQSRVAAPNG